MDAILHNSAISFIRSGAYDYSSGGISNRSGGGYYWASDSDNTISARILYFHSTNLTPQHGYHKGLGYSLRCLVPLEAWQLPTYSGTKSYQNLLVEVYGGTAAYLNNGHLDSTIQNTPTNLIRSGFYNYGSGNIEARKDYGRFWGPQSNSEVQAYSVYSTFVFLSTQNNYNKGTGMSLRCLVR